MFEVKQVYYPSAFGEENEGYQIFESDSDQDFYWINKYLHYVSFQSPNSARQYAYHITRFLNFLSKTGKSYLEATSYDLKEFLLSLTQKRGKDNEITQNNISERTMKSYLTTIKQLYIFLFEENKDFFLEVNEEVRQKNKHSFLYGSAWEETSYKVLIGTAPKGRKEPKEYERWYTKEQIEGILSGFNTYRDKALFSLTLDGLRIDEALSVKKEDVNLEERELRVSRSKGKGNGRLVILSDRSAELIREYLFNERDLLEEDLLVNEGRLPDRELFLNLRKRLDSYGKKVQYASWREILRRAAGKAGLDPSRIRTHSGRSTRAQELFNLQSEHPDKLSDNQIKMIMGWSNIDSANPYKNDLDRKTAINNQRILEQLQNGEENE